ncbi:hypothetical protein E2C01_014813 [Portunus trituberculatus]|uniref:Uncharacterized protein n=1 Tax=Portunus trituberculatus TaxID=210409 RepID=A0A5B7DLA8_PORTR|nr:hypothetical protein [Portunus trituberculatus]
METLLGAQGVKHSSVITNRTSCIPSHIRRNPRRISHIPPRASLHSPAYTLHCYAPSQCKDGAAKHGLL